MKPDTTTEQLPRTVGQALQFCAEAMDDADVYFGHGTDNAWDESVQLVLSVADLPLDADDGVLPHVLDEGQQRQLVDLLRRRIDEHQPLPYLLGKAWFAGLEFYSDARAIIPRSPLAELILSEFQPWYCGPQPTRILDLCCGGGCIGLATAHYSPSVHVDLVDLDPDALALARDNVTKLGLEDRASVIESDLFAALGDSRYDLILSNPPYVNSEDLATMPAEYHREPALALGSGPDGLALTRIILKRALSHLKDDGLLIVEVGNSWVALEEAYPTVPFTWLEFEHGGHGVFALSAKELKEFNASLAG
ncbi:MAG: 50S ribosomal protein L3 N(5)-glutamine methyltransferase [Halioglobus sp.]